MAEGRNEALFVAPRDDTPEAADRPAGQTAEFSPVDAVVGLIAYLRAHGVPVASPLPCYLVREPTHTAAALLRQLGVHPTSD